MNDLDLSRKVREQAWGRNQLMVIASFRYCLGRSTYIVSDCVEWLKQNWRLIDHHMQRMIKREIREAIKENRYGMQMDKEQWERVLDWE